MNVKRCPITYESVQGNQKFSLNGLKLLSRKLTELDDLPLSAEQLREQARLHSDKMSIQGVQPKLSAVLNIKNHCFDIVDQGGKYIIKPPSEYYPEVPANEDLSMRLAKLIGIEVPLHGLIYNKDGSLSYFIKRFDRSGHKDKIAVEDFSQLTGHTRDTKYNFSMERLIDVIDAFCTFPQLEKKRLFERTCFNYLIGNEDMHLKNYSLIVKNNKAELAPAYDFLNTTVILENTKEEIALPLNGRKRNLRRVDFVDYYGLKRLGLNKKTVNQVLSRFQEKLDDMHHLIKLSFLSDEMKERYASLLARRAGILF